MPKWMQSHYSIRKYTAMQVGRKFFLMKKGGHHGKSFCKFCNVSITSRKHDLKKQEKAKKHQNKLRLIG